MTDPLGNLTRTAYDALGSTLGLADASGTVQTSFTYGPLGNASSTGASSSNTQQYTGRPNDGTGLQYNRASYYSPTLQRFISEDHRGFGGGDVNLYSYVGNDPINLTDPSGACPWCVVGVVGACVAGGILGGYYGWRIGGSCHHRGRCCRRVRSSGRG